VEQPGRQHQTALRAFRFTTPDRRVYKGGKRYHPLEWEFAAQAALRDIRPVVRPPDFAVAGWNQADLVAAARFEVDRVPRPSVGHGWIDAAAVGVSWRGRGVGDALLDAVLDRMAERGLELGLAVLVLGAKVHRRNVNSQRLLDVMGGLSWQLVRRWRDLRGERLRRVGGELPLSEGSRAMSALMPSRPGDAGKGLPSLVPTKSRRVHLGSWGVQSAVVQGLRQASKAGAKPGA
jgi:GNAT superfamily N-acetyltransferase